MVGACIVSGRWNAPPCHQCHTMGEDFRLRQGCDGASVAPVALLPDGAPLFECPGKSVTSLTAVACGMFASWEKGRGIFAPCVMDEPAPLVDAMNLIGAEVAAFQRKESDRG